MGANFIKLDWLWQGKNRRVIKYAKSRLSTPRIYAIKGLNESKATQKELRHCRNADIDLFGNCQRQANQLMLLRKHYKAHSVMLQVFRITNQKQTAIRSYS